MIQKLRHTFILIMMTIVSILLIAIFVSLYFTSKFNYEQQCIEDLRSAARDNDSRQVSALNKAQKPEANALPGQNNADSSDPGQALRPGSETAPRHNDTGLSDTPAMQSAPTDSPDGTGQQDKPVSPPLEEGERALMVIDKMPDGTLHVVKNQLFRFEESDAESLIALIDESGSNTGMLTDLHLRFLWEPRIPDQITRYVLADTLAEEISLRSQLTNSLIIGLIAFALFLLCSILLAHWITAPVETAWNRQQQFVADASHELKTPLTVILANVSLLRSQSSDLSPENASCMEHIQAEADRMKELTENLLTLARSDSGHSNPEQKPVDFSYLVTNSTLTFEPVAFELGKTITGEIENDLMVMGDADRLRRLIDILMDNACKYSNPDSAIRVDLARCPSAKRSAAAKDLLLTVTSEGQPLTREQIDHIFLRFYRADPSRASVPGYGLGLSIAQVIVEEHNGKIEACSDGIKKNTFCVQLPLLKE